MVPSATLQKFERWSLYIIEKGKNPACETDNMIRASLSHCVSIISVRSPVQVIFWQTDSIVMSVCIKQLLDTFLLITSAASLSQILILNLELSFARGAFSLPLNHYTFNANLLVLRSISAECFIQQNLRESFVILYYTRSFDIWAEKLEIEMKVREMGGIWTFSFTIPVFILPIKTTVWKCQITQVSFLF